MRDVHVERPHLGLRLLLPGVILGLLAACGADSPKTATTVNGKHVFVMNAPDADCDDTEACSPLWTINGQNYEPGSAPDLPRKKVALYAVAGRGVPKKYEAWTIEHVDPSVALVLPQGSPCPGQSPTYLLPK